MPLYEYACEACGSTFEEFRKISQSHEGAPCPDCGAEARRVFSTPQYLKEGLSRSLRDWTPIPGGKRVSYNTKPDQLPRKPRKK